VDCRQIDRLLEASLDGRLSGFERMALRQHLKTCRVCRAKVDAMTAFSERVEKTLAGVESPDWRRLAPPAATASAPASPPPSAVGPAAPPAKARSAPPTPARARRKPWSPLGVAVAGAALIAVVVPFWTPPTRVPATTSWLDAAIAAEATRRAAGGRLDLVTDDPVRAAAWFGARGVTAPPALDLPAAVWLEGAFLTYYDGGRVAGLVLATPDGPLAVHLRPQAETAAAAGGGAAASADGEGLQAVEAATPAWRAAVIGAPAVVEGSDVEGWLAAALVPAPG
jgi:anti-sigma factor RsiW